VEIEIASDIVAPHVQVPHQYVAPGHADRVRKTAGDIDGGLVDLDAAGCMSRDGYRQESGENTK
jgi:hypothetical protein